jgi:hypothetical protein
MSMAPGKAERMNIEDPGKWLPFILDLNIVNAVKMTTDDRSHNTYGCSTVYCVDGETFIIDTPFNKFAGIWEKHVSQDNDEDDLDLGTPPSNDLKF